MQRSLLLTALLLATALVGARHAVAGQAPAAASDPDIPISNRDRVYSAEQFSNTVSVTDPLDNKLLGVIRLGDPLPANLSPLYRGQLLVHGLGFSPDHRTIAVVAIGSNAVNFIDTATNSVKHRRRNECHDTSGRLPDARQTHYIDRNHVSMGSASNGRRRTDNPPQQHGPKDTM